MLPLRDFTPVEPMPETKVETNCEIPKEMDIFFRAESQFLPEGKTFDELTKEEKAMVQAKFRFDPMKPGIYQGISGFGNMI